KATYKQAMERKLYDPATYVATNEHEYFAELSCCYLKKLDYYPRTRDELKKRDPKGYDLMHKVWGRAPEAKEPTTTATAGVKLASPDGDGQFPLKATRAEIQPGQTLVGTLPDKAQWAGRPVLAVEFPVRSGRALAAVSRLNALHADLEDFGLIAFGVETDEAKPAVVEKIARVRGITVPLVFEAEFGNRGGGPPAPRVVVGPPGPARVRGHPARRRGVRQGRRRQGDPGPRRRRPDRQGDQAGVRPAGPGGPDAAGVRQAGRPDAGGPEGRRGRT